MIMDASSLPQVFSIQLETEKKNTKSVHFISSGLFLLGFFVGGGSGGFLFNNWTFY